MEIDGFFGEQVSSRRPILGLCWPILGLCWPILGLCWSILKAMWAHLGAMLAHLGAMLAHLGAMLAHLGAMLAMFVQKHVECHRAKKHCKLEGVLSTRTPHREVGGRGGSPSLRRRGENCRTARTRQGAPWPDLSAYARQPARGPTMLAHLVAICWPMLAYVGLSCGQRGPILWLCWPMFASCWPMLSQKIRKMGTAKKRCKTQDILMVGGLSWGYVGPSWGYVGLS